MKWNGALTCPVLLLPARLSSRPPPGTTSDEGAGRRKELSRRSRESLAAHLGARRGGAVRRSVRGRRINGVSPPSPSPWVNPHGLHILYGFFMVFHSILALKMSIVSFNLVLFGLFFILCFETNVHFLYFWKSQFWQFGYRSSDRCPPVRKWCPVSDDG